MRNHRRILLSLVMASAALVAGVLHLEASPVTTASPVIEHAPVRLIPNHGYPALTARIETTAPVASAKLYFRAPGQSDFHFVEMAPSGSPGFYEGVLPIPEAGTAGVDYFFEVIDESFEIAWTPRYHALTTSAPTAATYARGDAQIRIGKTREGMRDAPRGFSTAGVVGFLGSATTPASTSTSTSTSTPTTRTSEAPVPAPVPLPVAPTPEEEEEEDDDDPGGMVPNPLSSGQTGTGTGLGTTSTSTSTASSGGGNWGTIAALGIAAGAGTGAAVLASQDSRDSNPGDIITPLEACFTVSPDPPRVPENGMIELNASCSTSGEPITSFVWELGDGRMVEGPIVQVSYPEAGDYNLLLRVGNGTGFAVSRRRVQVLPTGRSGSLAACITTDPFDAVVGVGENIRFNGSCSQPIENIVSYSWSLGDGRSRTGQAVNASYDAPGSYLVELTVGDDSGFASAQVGVTVVGDAGLTACFRRNPFGLEVPVGSMVDFDASCSSGNIVEYNWDFGDGDTGNGRNVSHTYGSSGTFRITLTISDGVNVQTKSETLRVTSGSPGGGGMNADLEGFLTGPTTALTGVPQGYAAVVRNNGPEAVDASALRWVFDGGSAPPVISAPVTCVVDPPVGPRVTVTCDTGAISAGSDVTVMVDVTFPTSETFTINIEVENLDPDIAELLPSNNSDSRMVTVSDKPPSADLRMTNLDADTNVEPGERAGADYTATVRNFSGDTVLVRVDFTFDVVSAPSPPGFVSGSVSCAAGSGTSLIVSCEPSMPLAPGESQDVRVTISFATGTYKVVAVVQALDPNVIDDLSNNSRMANINVPASADLKLTDLRGSISTNAGDDEEYEADYSSDGPDDTGARIVWTFTPAADVQSADGGCSPSSGSQTTVICNLGSLSDGSTGTRKVTVQFPNAEPMQMVQAEIESTSGIGDPNTGDNSRNRTVNVSPLKVLPLRVTFDSTMEVEGGGETRGRVVVNRSRTDVTDARARFRHAVEGRIGENVVQAVRLTSGAEGRWRFDFTDTPHFEMGSLQVRSGQVVTRGATSVTFRVSGSPGQTIEFSYRLRK